MHAVPRGFGLDREGPLPDGARPRVAPTTSTCCSSFGNNIVPGLDAPFAQTTICALGPSVDVAVVSLDHYFRDEIVERLTRDAERRSALNVAAG